MARPRTATNLLDARGSFQKNPQRKAERAEEPTDLEPLGDPPAGLSEREYEMWSEVVTVMHKGVVYEVDRFAVELAVRLITKMRYRFNDMTAAEMGRLQGVLGQLGMTPADRSKVQVLRKPETKNPWSDL